MGIEYTFQKSLDGRKLVALVNNLALATHSKQVQLSLDTTYAFYPADDKRNAYFNKPGRVFYSKNTDCLEFKLECDMDSGEDGALPEFSKIVFMPSETNTAHETEYANQLVALIPKTEKFITSSSEISPPLPDVIWGL